MFEAPLVLRKLSSLSLLFFTENIAKGEEKYTQNGREIIFGKVAEYSFSGRPKRKLFCCIIAKERTKILFSDILAKYVCVCQMFEEKCGNAKLERMTAGT